MYICNSLLEIRNYGKVILKLADFMDRYDITRNKLSKATGIKYSVIDRYYKANSVVKVDLDLLAKICFALGCKISDIMEYKNDEGEEIEYII